MVGVAGKGWGKMRIGEGGEGCGGREGKSQGLGEDWGGRSS